MPKTKRKRIAIVIKRANFGYPHLFVRVFMKFGDVEVPIIAGLQDEHLRLWKQRAQDYGLEFVNMLPEGGQS